MRERELKGCHDAYKYIEAKNKIRNKLLLRWSRSLSQTRGRTVLTGDSDE